MYSETPPIQPIKPAYRIRILNDEQLEQFKTNTFEILEKTGFHCPSEQALKIYAEHGGVVDPAAASAAEVVVPVDRAHQGI